MVWLTPDDQDLLIGICTGGGVLALVVVVLIVAVSLARRRRPRRRDDAVLLTTSNLRLNTSVGGGRSIDGDSDRGRPELYSRPPDGEAESSIDDCVPAAAKRMSFLRRPGSGGSDGDYATNRPIDYVKRGGRDGEYTTKHPNYYHNGSMLGEDDARSMTKTKPFGFHGRPGGKATHDGGAMKRFDAGDYDDNDGRFTTSGRWSLKHRYLAALNRAVVQRPNRDDDEDDDRVTGYQHRWKGSTRPTYGGGGEGGGSVLPRVRIPSVTSAESSVRRGYLAPNYNSGIGGRQRTRESTTVDQFEPANLASWRDPAEGRAPPHYDHNGYLSPQGARISDDGGVYDGGNRNDNRISGSSHYSGAERPYRLRQGGGAQRSSFYQSDGGGNESQLNGSRFNVMSGYNSLTSNSAGIGRLKAVAEDFESVDSLKGNINY